MKQKKHWKLALVCIPLILFVWFLLHPSWWVPVLAPNFEGKQACRGRLEGDAVMLYEYQRDNGQFPSSDHFQELFCSCRDTVLCPACSHPAGSWSNVDEWSDYIINSEWLGVQADPDREYPLMYDKLLANHGGKGITVMTAGLKVFWDKNAQWISELAKKHTNWHIRLPKDCP